MSANSALSHICWAAQERHHANDVRHIDRREQCLQGPWWVGGKRQQEGQSGQGSHDQLGTVMCSEEAATLRWGERDDHQEGC